MKKTLVLAALSSMSLASFGLSFATPAFAADDCIVHYVRTACPGKEDES